MRSYAVIDRYIKGKYTEVVKVVSYFDNYSRALERAERLRRVLNRLHDVIVVPFVSEPRAEWYYLRGSDVSL